MKLAERAREGRKDITSLAASSRFGNFKPESENAVRPPPEVKIDKRMDAIIGKWKEMDIKDRVEAYEHAWKILWGMGITRKDVEMFSVVLGGFQSDERRFGNAGVFLSAMMNRSLDDGFIIPTKHLGGLKCLGYQNVKNIVVYGDADECLGIYMRKGSIAVDGSVSGFAAQRMEGGRITIARDAGGWVGYDMLGGWVVVAGSADGCAGMHMSGGLIEIKGDCGEGNAEGIKGGTLRVHGDFRLSEKLFSGQVFHGDVRIFSGGG
jgi:formylmethanofuran dehydrogenase subunit C